MELPGIGNTRTATPRKILASLTGLHYLPGGRIIDGSKSRDLDNVGDIDVLTAGLLMGKITSSGKYAPSVIGVTTALYEDDGTTLNVSPAVAAEIARRIGTAGTLKIVGPPASGGVVAEVTCTFSAVNTLTGAITCSDMNAALMAGSFVCANDGSHVPVTLLTEEYGVKVTDIDGASVDVAFSKFAIAAQIDASQIRNYPADSSLKAWIKSKLRANGYGFTFDDDF